MCIRQKSRKRENEKSVSWYLANNSHIRNKFFHTCQPPPPTLPYLTYTPMLKLYVSLAGLVFVYVCVIRLKKKKSPPQRNTWKRGNKNKMKFRFFCFFVSDGPGVVKNVRMHILTHTHAIPMRGPTSTSTTDPRRVSYTYSRHVLGLVGGFSVSGLHGQRVGMVC